MFAVENAFVLEIFDGVPDRLREIAWILVESCEFLITNVARSA